MSNNETKPFADATTAEKRQEKLQKLTQNAVGVEEDVVESIFMHCGGSIHKSLVVLRNIYPHLGEKTKEKEKGKEKEKEREKPKEKEREREPQKRTNNTPKAFFLPLISIL